MCLVLSGSSTGHRQLQPRFYSFTLGHAASRKKALRKVTEGRSRRQGDFFFFNASGLHCRESSHKRMGSCRQAAGLRLSLSDHPSLPFVRLSSTPRARTHTHELKPPDRKYRLGSQRGFLIQTSPVEQPEVAAPTHLSFILALSLSLSGSVGFNQLPPHVLATRAYIKTHTHMSVIAHKRTPTTFSSSLEEPKAFGQLTKALCGLTRSRKEGECERRGLMI